MARRDPDLHIAGPAEEALYEAVIAQFAVMNDFFRAVRDETKRTLATERSAFYRYVGGKSIPHDRLPIYARILKRDVATFTRPEPAEPTWLPPLRQQLEDGVAQFLGVLRDIEAELKPAQPTRKRRGS